MLLFLVKRFGVMMLTALVLTFVVFYLTNLYPNLEKLAKTQANNRMTDDQVATWLDNRGYNRPVLALWGMAGGCAGVDAH
jgi:peptide/nickel transport system permease protein